MTITIEGVISLGNHKVATLWYHLQVAHERRRHIANLLACSARNGLQLLHVLPCLRGDEQGLSSWTS